MNPFIFAALSKPTVIISEYHRRVQTAGIRRTCSFFTSSYTWSFVKKMQSSRRSCCLFVMFIDMLCKDMRKHIQYSKCTRKFTVSNIDSRCVFKFWLHTHYCRENGTLDTLAEPLLLVEDCVSTIVVDD